MANIEIRTIEPHDAEVYWALRLEALKNEPEAFSSSYEEDVKKSIETVRSRILESGDQFILGAYDSAAQGCIVGMVGFKREQTPKLNHKGHVWGTYVKPNYRGLGIGRALLLELIDRAGKLEGLKHINLEVVTSNKSARELYCPLAFKFMALNPLLSNPRIRTTMKN